MPRRTHDKAIYAVVTDQEYVLLQTAAQGDGVSVSNLVRRACLSLLEEAGIDVPDDAFADRGGGRPVDEAPDHVARHFSHAGLPHEFTARQYAEIVGVTVNTARSRIKRAWNIGAIDRVTTRQVVGRPAHVYAIAAQEVAA